MSEGKAPVHVRTIRMEAVESGADELLVTGSLVDERPRGGPPWFGADPPPVIHHMTVTLRVRHPDLTITQVDAGMQAHPYQICPEAVPPLQGLVGLSVAQGFVRAVNERFGRARGCAHLTALIHALAPVVKQAAGVAFTHRQRPWTETAGLWFINTCQAWRENGPLHRLLASKDEAGLQRLSAYAKDKEPQAP
ncbi:MAG TPA: DUF2889 domain-containing protein [Methylomirabilota bacterium]|nr:DUF2889 domain-containing protein [Methylomirabilota bacterium]